MHIRSKGSQLSRPPPRSYSIGSHPRDSPPPPRFQQKFARFWASPGTTGDMSRISPPSPALSMPSPGKMRSSTGVQSVRKPSTASKPSSPPAQSLPSRTLTSHSGCTPMPPPQASELSSLKYKKARRASFVVPRAPLTRQRKHTSPLNWRASPSSGPSPNSVPTRCRCHSKYILTIMLYNGLRQCAQDLPSFIDVGRLGGVRLHREAPPREISNSRGWAQPLARRPPTP